MSPSGWRSGLCPPAFARHSNQRACLSWHLVWSLHVRDRTGVGRLRTGDDGDNCDWALKHGACDPALGPCTETVAET